MFSEITRDMVASTSAVGHSSIPRSAASWFLVGFVACLSSPVVRNMASKKQTMNRAFEPFRLVNTYGAFGSVSKFRPEIVIKATLELEGANTVWREYEVWCMYRRREWPCALLCHIGFHCGRPRFTSVEVEQAAHQERWTEVYTIEFGPLSCRMPEVYAYLVHV